MAIGFNTAGSSNSGAQQATLTLTIPAGVQAGDVMLLAVHAFFASAFTPAIASTGTAFTQIGSTQTSNNNSGFVANGSIWYAIASASDAGKVITASGNNSFWAMTVAAYTGASNITPVDVNGGAAGPSNALPSIACPSLTTGVDSDWAVYLCPFGVSGMTVAPALPGATQRANQNGSGVGTAVWDSNGSVGSASTPIGGGTITATGSIYWWTAFTVGLAPAVSGTVADGAPLPPVIPPHPHFTGLLLGEAWQRADWQAQGVADLTVAFSSTSGGVDTYNVTSPYNGGVSQPMRVLAPTAPSGDYPHGFLLILPVEAAGGTIFGDPVAVAQTLAANNAYNLTCVEPGFTADPWFADNPLDPAVRQETYLLKLLAWIKANLATTGTESVYLLGFSKSGPACQFLQFRHPDLFAAVAAWDFPAMMTDYDGTDPTFGGTVGGNSATVYGTSASFQTNYQLSAPSLANWAAPGRFGVNRIWIGGFASFGADVPAYDALLTAAGIPHTYTWSVSETHAWHADWVAAALASIIPSDFTEATTVLPQQVPPHLLYELLEVASYRLEIAAGGDAVSPAVANAAAGLATGTGAAQGPVPAAGVNAAAATGTGAAQSPVAAIGVGGAAATGTGSALNAAASTSSSGTAIAVLASGAGTGRQPVTAIAVNAAKATGTGAAQSAGQAAAVATLTASDTPASVLTATDQRTGGPG